MMWQAAGDVTHMSCKRHSIKEHLKCTQNVTSHTQTHYFLWYLKESSPEDLKGHGEGEGGALPTLSKFAEGRQTTAPTLESR